MKKRKTYTDEQKQEAIKLAKETSYYKASKKLGINKGTIRSWCDPEYAELKRKKALDDYHKKTPEQKRKETQEYLKRVNDDPEAKERRLKRRREGSKKRYNEIKDTEEYKERSRKRYRDNIEYFERRRIIWRQENLEYHKYLINTRHKERIKEDPAYRIRSRLRGRLSSFLKTKNSRIIVDEIGCTSQELKDHIESLWEEGMTWDNYGHGEGKWTLDHIKPLSAFGDDILTEEGQKEANHYTNIQPMWYLDNMKKSNKFND